MSRTTYVLALGAFGIITTEFGIIGILPDVAAYFQISIDKAGLLVSLFALAVAVSSPFMTLLFSRFDRKQLVQGVLLIFIVSNILSALSGSFATLLLARVLPAFFLSVYFSNGLVMAAESVGKGKAMKAVATVYGGVSIGAVIGIPMAAYMADLFDWKVSLWMAAVINAIAFSGIWFLVPSMPAQKRLSYGGQLSVLKKKTLWLNILTVVLIAAGSFSVYSYFADYLEKVFDMNGRQVSGMLILFGLTGILGNWAAGQALSKSIRMAMLTYMISMGLIFIFLYHMNAGFMLQVGIIGIWGFFHMAGFVISQSWINSAAPEAPEFANSLVLSTANTGIACGAALGGFIIAHFGIHQVLLGGIALFSLALIVNAGKLPGFTPGRKHLSGTG